MKQTLLEMVQDILASIGGDEVNSITDTEEALDVARIIRDSYEHIVTHSNLPEHWTPFELTATAITSPTVMLLPNNIMRLSWVKYNKKLTSEDSLNFDNIEFMPWDAFASMMYEMDSSVDNVETVVYTVGSDSIDLVYATDKMPEYYTTWNDNIIIFDSYDNDEDAFLQKNKTLCFGKRIPTTFTLTDGFTPELDHSQFNLLKNESKAQAYIEIKQAANVKAEQRARRGWIHTQNNKYAIKENNNPLDNLPNYGRKR